MSNHVSQPVAQALKVAGWEGRTDRRYYEGSNKEWYSCRSNSPPPITMRTGKWLPAPNISEIRKRLTKTDFENYIMCHSLGYASAYDWLFTVTASADALAKVWLWVTSNKEGE